MCAGFRHVGPDLDGPEPGAVELTASPHRVPIRDSSGPVRLRKCTSMVVEGWVYGAAHDW